MAHAEAQAGFQDRTGDNKQYRSLSSFLSISMPHLVQCTERSALQA
jgi:hypothetical protein